MRRHNFLSGNYLIVGSGVGGWSQNGRPLASGPFQSGPWTLGLPDRTREILLQIDTPCLQACPEASQRLITLPAYRVTRAQTGLLLRAYARCDITADFGKGSPQRSIPRRCPSHFLTVFLGFCSIIYWPARTAQSATVAVSEAGIPQRCRVYACFLGSSISSELYMNSWIDACFIA